MRSHNREFKLKSSIALYGASDCGKTAIIERFIFEDFADRTQKTYVDTLCRYEYSLNGDLFDVTILDTCGMEGVYDQGLDDDVFGYAGFLVVFSLVDRYSFDLAVELMYMIWEKLGLKEESFFPGFLVGTKADVTDEKRQVTTNECRDLAGKYHTKFYEVSSKSGLNVKTVFQKCVARTKLLGQFHLFYVPDPPMEEIPKRKIKLVIVGEENVGKTHLSMALQKKKYIQNLSTDGIDISSMEYKKNGSAYL
eukprot:TRINITY_DN12468_c0_g1_i1.p1 TRINITY_DN12468_c0_g1~~TRINITY_DN12468_c0_g1_i1.p1  ORF type:complete len:251 (+),score=64.87 TRINITY_DN12468_c0_g1_i1:1-753(+)